MKNLYIFLIIIIFSACASEQRISVSGKEYIVSKSLGSFITQFELATVNHNKVKLLSLLDTSYKEVRYAGLSKHEKEDFFREFFCGNDIKTKQTICPGFGEVDRIEFISIHQNNEETYTIKYIVHTIYEDLAVEWKVTVNENNEISTYAIKPMFF